MSHSRTLNSIGIIGIGKSLPKNIVTNNDLVKRGIETSDEWIVERTGIKQRHIADDQTATSDLAYQAAKQAIESASLSEKDIDLIIVATTSPDYLAFPSTACIVQDKLGLNNIPAFDVSAACTGFCYAFTTAASYIASGLAKNALVIGADCLTKLINWEDRSTCILFGDGAGAVVLSDVPENYGILAASLHSDGSAAQLLKLNSGGTRNPLTKSSFEAKDHMIFMEGKSVFKKAVQELVPCIKKTLKKANMALEDIDFFIPHQANVRIIEHAREKIGLTKEQVYINIHKYGNTSAASIPIALFDAVDEGLMKDGSNLLIAGFGAGFTWGANLIKWSKI
jgi:3-oxoacyl-[acyl-carrier-protein] synthase III